MMELRNIGRYVQSGLRRLWRSPSGFAGSRDYWAQRYNSGGDSGAGSYGKFAEFKARILNEFVAANNVQSVIEYGCGDGNQLSLAKYPRYLGFDVSPRAIEVCRAKFQDDATKRFKLMDEFDGERADLAISLDVIYHLVEDNVYERYMSTLFDSALAWVIVYSSDFDGPDDEHAPHVRHRRFSRWVADRRHAWTLAQVVDNEYPYDGSHLTGSRANFYFFARRTEDAPVHAETTRPG